MIGSKISRRYAKALLSLGEEDGQYVQYGENLKEFARFCKENDEFFRVVSSRLFKVEDRKKILESILQKSNLSEMVNNFLELLIDKNRIGAISEISEHYSKLTDEISNISETIKSGDLEQAGKGPFVSFSKRGEDPGEGRQSPYRRTFG